MRILRRLILLPLEGQPLMVRIRWFRLMVAALALDVLSMVLLDSQALTNVCVAVMFVCAFLWVRYRRPKTLRGAAFRYGWMTPSDYRDSVGRVARSAIRHRKRKTKRFLKRLQKADKVFEGDPFDVEADHFEGKPNWAISAHYLAIHLTRFPSEFSPRGWENLFELIETGFFNSKTIINGQNVQEVAEKVVRLIDLVSEFIERIEHPESERALESLEPLRNLARAGPEADMNCWANYRVASSDLIDFGEKVCI